MVTFLKDCNNSKGKGPLMICTILDMVTSLGMVTVLRMETIIGMMTNDHPRDGGRWDRLEDFDHFGEGDLPKDGDHPKNGDQHRDAVPP